MGNKYYNNNSLEAVTQGKVCGDPTRSYDPFRLVKTIVLISAIISNNNYADDVVNEIHAGFDKFNEISIIKIEYTKQRPETAEEAEVRYNREIDEARDIALNKAEVKEGRYWVDGRWIQRKPSDYQRTNAGWVWGASPNAPARSEEELVDSDGDGYDDYTEFKYGTSPNNPKLFPAIRDGNNKKIFK